MPSEGLRRKLGSARRAGNQATLSPRIPRALHGEVRAEDQPPPRWPARGGRVPRHPTQCAISVVPGLRRRLAGASLASPGPLGLLGLRYPVPLGPEPAAGAAVPCLAPRGCLLLAAGLSSLSASWPCQLPPLPSAPSPPVWACKGQAATWGGLGLGGRRQAEGPRARAAQGKAPTRLDLHPGLGWEAEVGRAPRGVRVRPGLLVYVGVPPPRPM